MIGGVLYLYFHEQEWDISKRIIGQIDRKVHHVVSGWIEDRVDEQVWTLDNDFITAEIEVGR